MTNISTPEPAARKRRRSGPRVAPLSLEGRLSRSGHVYVPRANCRSAPQAAAGLSPSSDNPIRFV